MRPTNIRKADGSDAAGVVKVRVQGKSIIGDNIVTDDDENENNDAKPVPKTEAPKAAGNAPKLDENQIQNLILTSLKKIVATETASPQKKPSVVNTGTANKTIARPKFPPRVAARNTGNLNRSAPTGNRNDGGNTRGNNAPLNRNFGGNGNNMLSDFGLNRNLSFGNDIGSNMGGNMGNNLGNSMGGNVSFAGNLRANSSFDNNMMRGGLSNTSDFNSDFSSIGMRRNMMGLGSNSNSMGSNGRGFDNNSGMGMGSFSGNLWNSNSSNGGGGGGSGYNNSWGSGNSNRF